jgi:hypothetical protein
MCDCSFNNVRPTIKNFPGAIKYNQVFPVTFAAGAQVGLAECVQYSAPYTTHSYSQGQRQARLKSSAPVKVAGGWTVQCTAVSSANMMPPAYYMLFLVQNGIPSRGVWVKQN